MVRLKLNISENDIIPQGDIVPSDIIPEGEGPRRRYPQGAGNPLLFFQENECTFSGETAL
jgi:hypothetical protein